MEILSPFPSSPGSCPTQIWDLQLPQVLPKAGGLYSMASDSVRWSKGGRGSERDAPSHLETLPRKGFVGEGPRKMLRISDGGGKM